jgi:hypothetical protein
MISLVALSSAFAAMPVIRLAVKVAAKADFTKVLLIIIFIPGLMV